MTYEEFEQRAWQEWERIPEEYRSGVDGLVIERAALPHAELADIYTLGECRTESYPSDYGGPDTIRSVVVLYYGSFFRLSRLDRDFDWQAELWETLTHELQHHLESLAADDALGGMDYAADENYRRYQGEAFDPFFYRHGLEEDDGWRRVEDEHFLEISDQDDRPIEFTWHGRRYRVADSPAGGGDVVFLTLHGVADAPGALHLVRVQPPNGWFAALGALLRRRPVAVTEVEVDVEAVGDTAGEG